MVLLNYIFKKFNFTLIEKIKTFYELLLKLLVKNLNLNN